MDLDLEQAIALLKTEGCTCVLQKADTVYKSHRRGVAPLMGWLEEGTDLKDFAAADKVVGKATAFLYRLLGVRCVYAGVMSLAAAGVLEAGNIPFQYGRLVEAIQNRTGTGLCPMELATRDISNPEDAPATIRAALARLQNS